MWSDFRHKPNKCPCCGYLMDASTTQEPNSKGPSKSDIALCFGCAELLIFDFPNKKEDAKELILRMPTKEEVEEMKASDGWSNIIEMQQAILKVRSGAKR